MSAESQLEQFEATASSIDLDKANSVYSTPELNQRVKDIQAGGALVLPTWRERQIMRQQGLPLADIINRQRTALGQDPIPRSVWEEQIAKLGPRMCCILEPNTTDDNEQELKVK